MKTKTNKQANLSTIVLVQQLEKKYWEKSEITEPILEQARNGDCKPLLAVVTSLLDADKIEVSEAYGILHDKDLQIRWDEDTLQNETVNKAKHVLFLFKFEKGATLTRIALAIGIEPQYLEKMKSGRYGYDNSLAYLCHRKDDKYQYRPEDVVTLRGEDYLSIYSRRIDAWEKGRAIKSTKETNESVDWLVAEILEGKITKGNILLTDDYFTIYGQHKRRINEALDTAVERKSLRTIESLENSDFKKTVIFVSGPSGGGKTKFCKEITKKLQGIVSNQNENWESCITASSNAFDEYFGQEILLLDDFRANYLLTGDMLKLLDPYSMTPISARYHNKTCIAKVIFITNTSRPADFFYQIKDSQNEDFGQFFRRIDYWIDIKNTEFTFLKPIHRSMHSYIKTANNYTPKIEHSYSFIRDEVLDRDAALNKTIEMIATNMKWKQKGLASDNSQDIESKPHKDTK